MNTSRRPGRPRVNAPGTTASQRVRQSIDQLKAAGGDRKTFRLRAPALKALAELVDTRRYPNETAAVEGALFLARSSDMTQPSLYPLHVDSAPVQEAVEAAVQAACKELDVLFPGAKPEVNGVSSNFAGLLEKHIQALLTGKTGYTPSHLVELPVLLATDHVFGKPFDLPEEQGCGYMVVDETTRRVLSAYSGRFSYALQETQPSVGDFTYPLKGARSDGLAATKPGQDVDVLFSTHEGAVSKALTALEEEGAAPKDRKIRIVTGLWDDEKEQYVEYVAAEASA
jgi:hypothetical protein